MSEIYIHRYVHKSKVNGPGIRAVIWTQGCQLQCHGCFNPETHHTFHNGHWHDPVELGHLLGQQEVSGITVSGGEPLDQPAVVSKLVQAFREVNQGTALLFSGYHLAAIKKSPERAEALLQFDAAIAGPYIADPNQIWKNKQLLLLTNRISADELAPERKMEVSLHQEQTIVISGYPTGSQLHTLKEIL